ncbi:hypothetical protein CRG98_021236 [Punica granatum]|uniref:Uncharacterized protein n=1 Tax=Punica granatum TaxID=22663 RepID=A0A2I0JQ34_PUNGR|nr:hypothetical protein CRG98_021236 [Punica granatum]
MCSRQGMHARDRIARLGSVHFPGGCVTDTREKESPLPIYNSEVEGRTGKSEFGSSRYVRAYIPHALSVRKKRLSRRLPTVFYYKVGGSRFLKDPRRCLWWSFGEQGLGLTRIYKKSRKETALSEAPSGILLQGHRLPTPKKPPKVAVVVVWRKETRVDPICKKK